MIVVLQIGYYKVGHMYKKNTEKQQSRLINLTKSLRIYRTDESLHSKVVRISSNSYQYDKLNRLVSSVYGEGPSFSEHVNRYSESIPQYTANGAIKKIIRHGLKQNGEYGKIDNLDISLNGNQLSRVDDDALPVLRKGATDFYDNKVKTTGAEYEYDENGALIMDANRGITRIEYDMLDNPTLIQFSDGSQTEYVYTSAGEKLRTIHRTATPNITIAMGEKKNLTKEEILEADSTDYIGSFIFENSKPGKYLFGGGYYTYATAKSGYSNYHYFLTDHLGNNRVVENENDSIEQVTHYYPFGSVYADAGLNTNMQKYKYNGKELDQMHGLNSYDYGARQYYPTVPIWDRIDPLSEKYYSISPYAYCVDNPINKIDINGLFSADSLAEEYAKYHNVSLANVHYAKDKGEWYVAFDKGGEYGYSRGGILERRFEKTLSDTGLPDAVGGAFESKAESDFNKDLERSSEYVIRDKKGNNLNSVKPTFKMRHINHEFNLRNAEMLSKGLRIFGYIGGGYSIFETVKEIKHDEKKIIGEGGLDIIMTGVGLLPGYGWIISSGYFIGKGVLEYNHLDFWNKKH